MIEWQTIIEPASATTADEAFDTWKQENSELYSQLTQQQIRRDLIRSAEGELVRYRIAGIDQS